MMRFLQVFIGANVAGIVSDQKGDWAFEYSNEWLQHPNGFALSPALPLRLELFQDTPFARPVQSFFENLLPPAVVQTQWSRYVRIQQGDTFGLLMLFGQECLGSIQLLPPTEKYSDAIKVEEIPSADVQQWVLQLAQRPLLSQLNKKMMLPLEYPQLPIIYFDQRFFQPVGQMVGTHWVIFNQQPQPLTTFPSFAVNHWFCTRLAASVGLPVPEVQFHFGDIWMCVVTRTDRQLIDDVWQRLPMLHAGQLLNVPQAESWKPLRLEHLQKMIEASNDIQQTAEDVFAWVFFHLLIGSDHLRLVDLYGLVHQDGVQIAPFLPIFSKNCYQTLAYSGHAWPTEASLSLSIGDAENWQALTLRSCYSFAEALGLERHHAKQIVFKIVRTLMLSAQQLVAEFEQMFQDSERERQLFTAPLACAPESLSAAQQCMRSIQYGVLQTMIHQMVEDSD